MHRSVASRPFVFVGVTAALAAFGCGKKAPSDVQAWVDAERATAITVAEAAAKACVTIKDRSGLPGYPAPIEAKSVMPPSAAKGTSLEADPHVVDVYVGCMWPVPGSASTSHGASTSESVGTSMTPLRAKIEGPPSSSGPSDFTENNCTTYTDHHCERLRFPSGRIAGAKTADFIVTRPAPDGATAETTVVFAEKP